MGHNVYLHKTREACHERILWVSCHCGYCMDVRGLCFMYDDYDTANSVHV